MNRILIDRVIMVIAVTATVIMVVTSSNWSERFPWILCGVWQGIAFLNAETIKLQQRLLTMIKESQCPQNRMS